MSDDALRVYKDIKEYCDTYNVPLEYFMDILEDQKVVPMIRGKATEFIGAVVLKRVLDTRDWVVEKLNLNAQPGVYDEDVSIIHRRTGLRLRAETKNAVRGKFSLGTRKTPAPHFTVKCHKSRSHMTRERNDRYLATDFDVLLCSVSNSIFRSTRHRGLPLIDDAETLKWLKNHYGVTNDGELRRATYDDWRVCIPSDIAEEGNTIPRTPRVLMIGDPAWFVLDQLEARLRDLINNE